MKLFSEVVADFGLDIQEVYCQVIRKVAMDLYVRIVMRTPVDTGRARGNWLVAVGTVPTETADQLRKSADRATAMSVLSDYDAVEGLSIYIVNNLEYVPFLEAGTSKQAPDGMVKITVDEFMEIARRSMRGT